MSVEADSPESQHSASQLKNVALWKYYPGFVAGIAFCDLCSEVQELQLAQAVFIFLILILALPQ